MWRRSRRDRLSSTKQAVYQRKSKQKIIELVMFFSYVVVKTTCHKLYESLKVC